jgi:hypothetical protein
MPPTVSWTFAAADPTIHATRSARAAGLPVSVRSEGRTALSHYKVLSPPATLGSSRADLLLERSETTPKEEVPAA